MGNNNICLICFIGLPASGKTYLSSAIAADRLGFTKVTVQCYDDLIKWNTDNFVWKEERKKVYLSVENEIKSFLANKTVHDSLLIIIDDNMYYRSMRYEYYKLAKTNRIKYCQIYLNVPIVKCLERNYTRPAPLPTYQLLNINEKLEMPSLSCNWETSTLHLGEEDSPVCLDKIRSLIVSTDIPVDSELHDYEIDRTQNYKHTADLALRKIISLKAKEIISSPETDTSEKMSKLVKKKSEILDLINNNELPLPSDQDVGTYVKHLYQYMTL